MRHTALVRRLLLLVALLIACCLPLVSQTTHKVKRGETMESIAKKYDIKLSKLKKANKGLREVKRGQVIQIPVATKNPKSVAKGKKETTKGKSNVSKGKTITAKGKSATAEEREKERAKAAKEREKERAKAAKEREKSLAKAAKEREKAQKKAAKQRERAAKEREKAAKQREKEKLKAQKQAKRQKRAEKWDRILDNTGKVLSLAGKSLEVVGSVASLVSGNAWKSSGSNSDYASDDVADVESMDMKSIIENEDPDLRERRKALIARLKENQRQLEHINNRQRAYIPTATKRAASADKLAELKSEEKELRREQKELRADLNALDRESRERRAIANKEEARRAAEAREAQRQADQERIDRDYERDTEKTERDKQELFKLGKGEKYLKQYAFHKDIVYGIKIRSASYANYTIDEKRRAVKKSQREMKEYREKYRKGAGSDIPGASNSLENWEPTDKELRQK